MTTEVIYIDLPNTRDNVVELFKKHGVSAVPVLKNRKVVGIVTRKDILRKIDEDQVAFLMTPNPITVSPEDDIERVVKILTETDFRRLPVVEGGELKGIITVRDIIEKISEMKIDKPIREYVDNISVCIWQDTPLNVAGEIMRLANAELCPILDDDAKVVGIIDEKIVLTETLIEEFLESTTYTSSSDTDDSWTWDGIRDYSIKYFEVSVIKLPKEPVKKFMKSPVFVYPTTSVSKTAKAMVENDLDYLPVIDANGRVSGLISDKKLIRVLVDEV